MIHQQSNKSALFLMQQAYLLCKQPPVYVFIPVAIITFGIMQQSPSMEVPIALPIILAVFFLAGFAKFKRHQSSSRLISLRERENKRIDQSKIIVAIEPLDIFVSVSSSRKDRYIELNIERTGIARLVFAGLRMLGKGVTYYKVKDEQKKSNIAFLEALLQTKRVHLVLYTTLEPEVADCLLRKLDLAKYFRPQNRIFPSENLKHPTEIDSNTKRIIILTATRKDHIEQDSQYFLVVKKKTLKDYSRVLTELINNNQSIDDLHNEFVHWKIEMESDYDSAQEKTE